MWALAASATRLYVGGDFTAVNGQPRERLAAVDPTTGEIGPWAPHVPCCGAGNLGVWALETDPLRGRLYVGGDFTEIENEPHERFAQFSGLGLKRK